MPLDLPAAFAGIANRVTAAFGGPFYDGLVVVPGTGGGLDDSGIFQPGSPATQIACRVMVDEATEQMRLQEGFADGDAVLIVLASGLGVGLTTDMQILIPSGPRAGTWLISQIGRDPAGIGWSTKGRRA